MTKLNFVNRNDFYQTKIIFVDELDFVERKFTFVHICNIITRWQQFSRNCIRKSSFDWFMSTHQPINDSVMNYIFCQRCCHSGVIFRRWAQLNFVLKNKITLVSENFFFVYKIVCLQKSIFSTKCTFVRQNLCSRNNILPLHPYRCRRITFPSGCFNTIPAPGGRVKQYPPQGGG